jgi:hypothetical protein
VCKCDKGSTARERDYNFFYGKGNENYQKETELFEHNRILSAVKRVEFVSDRMSYIVLRDRWINIFVLNVHTSSAEKHGDSKDRFCKEFEQVFLSFS